MECECNILISVIVTVYNVDKYLDKCLDSIVNQSYKNMEIILVNDGSTDNSLKICHYYANLDDRIVIIDKKNEGLVAARKTGIKVATGMYVGYVDGDDWIDKNMYEEMISTYLKNKADIIVSGCIKEGKKVAHKMFNNIPAGYYCKTELLTNVYPKMLYFDGFFKFGIQQYLWNKLFRREILSKYQLLVDNCIKNGEDVACVYPCLLEANSIEIMDTTFYHYRIHDESMTSRLNELFLEDSLILYNYLKQIFVKSPYYHIMIRQLNKFILYLVCNGSKYVLDAKINVEFTSKFEFPFMEIPEGSKLYIVGEGIRMIEYLRQLKYSSIYKVLNYYNLEEFQKQLDNSIGNFIDNKYDYIVIAVTEPNEQIELVASLKNRGINGSKIICDYLN